MTDQRPCSPFLKSTKSGEKKLLNNVWGEVPPGEISEA